MYNKKNHDVAFDSIGPAFEELSNEELVNTDAAVWPIFVATGKLLLSALGGSAITFTIDKLKQ